MTRKKLLILLGSVCLILVLAVLPFMTACAPAAPEAPEEIVITIGTGPVGGSWFPFGAVVCTIINEHVEGVRAAPCLGGAVANAKACELGDQLIAMTNSPTDKNAWAGVAPFEKQHRNLRGLWMNYPEISHIFTLAEANIKSVSDLKGKRVSPMYEGSTGFVMNQRYLEEYGMTIEDFSKCTLIGYSGGADLLKDKHLDAYMINTMPPNAAFLDVCTFTEIHIIALDPDKINSLIAKDPSYIHVTIPGGTYPGNPDDIHTVGYKCGFTANKDLPEDVAYEVVKAFWANYEMVMHVNPSFPIYIIPENAFDGMVLPLHPGAYRYYKEQGYEIPDHIMPID